MSHSGENRARLTFGVEIEFSIATVCKEMTGKDGEDPEPNDPRTIFGLTEGMHENETTNVREHIAKTLREKAGVIAGTSIWDLVEPAEAWIVETDVTIKAPDRKYLYHRIEVKSPAYYFSPEALMVVKKVCQILSHNYRISCNESCALHVHVGNGEEGFSVETIRLFLATIWTFEPVIDKLHPEYRRGNDDYSPSFRGRSRLAQRVMYHRNPAQMGLEVLLSGTTSISDLAEDSDDSDSDYIAELKVPHSLYQLINFSRPSGNYGNLGAQRSCYNLRNLFNDDKRTVEMRQHESTLNPERVANWIALCVGLLEFADSGNGKEKEEILKKHIGLTKENTPEQVLRLLGLPVQASFYGRRLSKFGEEVQVMEGLTMPLIEL